MFLKNTMDIFLKPINGGLTKKLCTYNIVYIFATADLSIDRPQTEAITSL